MKNFSFSVIDLPQALPGYERFLSCWLVKHRGKCFLIDPGPASSIQFLLKELQKRQVENVDLVLVSHIHLDHSGGLAELLRLFPKARVYAHPKGREHLCHPQALWEGSVKTLGKVAEAYGRPQPINEENLADESELEKVGIRAILTPGHAAHHCSFLMEDVLFAGEAVATRLPVASDYYLRPATPPKFLPEIFLASLKALENIQPEPRYLAFAHYGIGRGVRNWIDRARRQLQLWLQVVEASEREDRPAWREELLRRDPDFARIKLLPRPVQEREFYYAENSLWGMWDYFSRKRSA